MIIRAFSELPEVYRCKVCGEEKPVEEMVVVKTGGKIILRPRCKKCHNTRERGHRREWKRNYLRGWRSRNSSLNESYWRARSVEQRAHIAAVAARRFNRNHDAILVQGRMRRQTGQSVTIQEARELVRRFGRCYPTRYGLTEGGLRECERIRSRLRQEGLKMRPVEIRMMVYEDGHFIKPRRQTTPYRSASRSLANWWKRKKEMEAAA